MTRALILFQLFLLCSSAAAAGDAPGAVLVYRGPGACAGCPEAVGKILKEMGYPVRYVKPGMLTATHLGRAALYVQPGGSDRVLDTLEALSGDEVRNLRDFVSNGGRYLGICAGGYLAGSMTEDDHGILVPAFGLLPSVIEEELGTDEPKVMAINWLGSPREVYYQAGPWFDLGAIPGAKSFGTYRDSGHSMALIAENGTGKVGVIGPHLEAGPDWFTEDNLPVPASLSYALLKDFIRELLGHPSSALPWPRSGPQTRG